MLPIDGSSILIFGGKKSASHTSRYEIGAFSSSESEERGEGHRPTNKSTMASDAIIFNTVTNTFEKMRTDPDLPEVYSKCNACVKVVDNLVYALAQNEADELVYVRYLRTDKHEFTVQKYL